MEVIYTANFLKKFKKLTPKQQSRVEARLRIFVKDEFSPILNAHKLHGEYSGYWSLNVTGDMRIVYKKINSNICQLHALGTHSELYE